MTLCFRIPSDFTNLETKSPTEVVPRKIFDSSLPSGRCDPRPGACRSAKRCAFPIISSQKQLAAPKRASSAVSATEAAQGFLTRRPHLDGRLSFLAPATVSAAFPQE